MYLATNKSKTTAGKDNRYGDTMKPKGPGVFRIGCQNVNNMAKKQNTAKSKTMISHLSEGEYDVFMMSEIGLFWPNIEARDSWAERTMFNFPNKSVFSYNTTEETCPNNVRQFGGTGIISTQEASSRTAKRGKDLSGLGRWFWIDIQGKEGNRTMFISAYRPVRNVERTGSVFQQHLRGLSGQDNHRDPLDAFDEDLERQLRMWMAQGYHIILGMDANCKLDESSELEKRFFSLGGLHNLFARSATPNFGTLPGTCNKSQHSFPIDRIWVSPSIQVSSLGFHGFDEAIPSDHRCLWFDISFSILFGHRSPPLPRNFSRRLTSKDSRIVRKYNTMVAKKFNDSKLFEKAESLSQISTEEWSPVQEKLYNKIHMEATTIRLKAEKELRKVRMGGVPWSPKLQQYRDKIELWQMVVKRKKGLKTSLTRIRRYMQKTGIHALTSTLAEANTSLNTSFKAYREAKKGAEMWRDDHLEALLDALATKNQITREKQMANMRTIEQQRRLARSSKRARGKLGKNRVTKVWFKDEMGMKCEASSKKAMEEAIIQENISRFRQTEGTPPMRREMLDLVGDLGELPALDLILQGYEPWSEDLPKHFKEFLSAMKRPDNVMTFGNEDLLPLDDKAHRLAWTKQNEPTASEPSAPSFSHFKAALDHEPLTRFDATMRSLPYRHGFSPMLWRIITDVSMETGLAGNLFVQDPEHWSGIVSQCWLLELWKFLFKYQIRVYHPLPSLQVHCGGDTCLSSLFANKYSGQDLYKLNQCRLFLRVIFVSDICTLDGERIAYDSWHGKHRQDLLTQVATWPNSPRRLPESWWALWQQALDMLLCIHPMSLRYPINPPFPRGRWHWWYNTKQAELFHLQGHLWRRFSPKFAGIVRTRATRFYRGELVFDLPHDLVPVAVIRWRDSVSLDANVISSWQTPLTSLPGTEDGEHLETAWEASELNASTDNLRALADSFMSNKLLHVGSDGSYKDNLCTAACVVTDGNTAVSGTSVIPGTTECNSAF